MCVEGKQKQGAVPVDNKESDSVDSWSATRGPELPLTFSFSRFQNSSASRFSRARHLMSGSDLIAPWYLKRRWIPTKHFIRSWKFNWPSSLSPVSTFGESWIFIGLDKVPVWNGIKRINCGFNGFPKIRELINFNFLLMRNDCMNQWLSIGDVSFKSFSWRWLIRRFRNFAAEREISVRHNGFRAFPERQMINNCAFKIRN